MRITVTVDTGPVPDYDRTRTTTKVTNSANVSVGTTKEWTGAIDRVGADLLSVCAAQLITAAAADDARRSR